MSFQRNRDKDMLITDIDNVNYKVQDEDLSLFLPYIKFNPSVDAILNKQWLSKENTLRDIENSAPRRKEDTIAKLCRKEEENMICK